jgi:uncharacterized RDD family membrane protein YckC
MDPERWRNVSTILAAVSALSKDERAAFLEEACGGDEALRREVESRLATADPTIQIVDTPAGEASVDDVSTRTMATLSRSDLDLPSLAPGQLFGPYRVERLLGRGGMGEVYVAEERETGRRVALKVLRRASITTADRARFLREGRLAASVSHPNVVYVFGSADIAGTPVIVMELVPGGTLKDRVLTTGPFKFTEAVDAILEVIAGLEAAGAAGILHRDIKPSNCFTDTDGHVKIGDFGLSISTQARAETTLTAEGLFLGTPAFAAPEQLRGEALDVRSDIYAVGATLFYVLTGQPPIDDTDFVRLIARITQEAPPSPRALRPGLPVGLATVVLRCLAKDPARRFKTYSDLVATLEPFSSVAAKPAPIGLRLTAGVLDVLIVEVINTLAIPSVMRQYFDPIADPFVLDMFGQGLQVLIYVMYFGCLEGIWACSVGKRICGIRVATSGGETLAARTAWKRAFAFASLMMIANLFGTVVFPLLLPASIFRLAIASRLSGLFSLNFTKVYPGVTFGFRVERLFSIPFFLSFTTARRTNSYAALHDLLTKTRVFQNEDRRRSVALITPPLVSVPAGAPRIGPFVLMKDAAISSPPGLAVGYDVNLSRYVWIDRKEMASPPVPTWRRDLRRRGRVRWLAGRRAVHETWDAYEAVPGQSLIHQMEQPWSAVRDWLHDLSVELSTGLDDRSLPDLSLERVWIGATGRVCLLEWLDGTNDNNEDHGYPDHVDAQRFLFRVAGSALEGRSSMIGPHDFPHPTPPLPVGVTAFLQTLAKGGFPDYKAVTIALSSLTSSSTVISHWRRASHLVVCAILTYVIVGLMFVLAAVRPLVASIDVERRSQVSMLLVTLNALRRFDTWEQQSPIPGIVERREALEIYIRSQFVQTFQDALVATDPTARQLQNRALRSRAEDVMRLPPPSVADLARAEGVLSPQLNLWKQGFASEQQLRNGTSLRGLVALGLVIVGCLISPALFKGGGLLHALGIAVVSHEGKRVSRLRAVSRALIAWLPIGVFLMMVSLRLSPDQWWLVSLGVWNFRWIAFSGSALVGLALFIVGGVFATVHPGRGLQDWVTGTWLVPL